MADIILLSDNLSNPILGDSRYMAPYTLSSQLENAGFDVAVIDYFTRLPEFDACLEKYLSPSTLFVGLSSTFLSYTVNTTKLLDKNYRDILVGYHGSLEGSYRAALREKYESPGLWLPSTEHLQKWLTELREKMKLVCPTAKIILGGAKTRLFMQKETPKVNFDYLALSASDKSLIDVAKALSSGKVPNFYEVNGYKIIDNREELKNKFCPEAVFSKKSAVRKKEALPIEVSRGCIFNCKFCHYDKKESIRKDLEILKREIVRNYETFGTTVYHFCDDCFNDSRKKVEETCNALMSLPFKIEWVSFARVDVAIRFPETLALMIDSGASGIFWGIESFNKKAAFLAGKRIPPDEVKEFLIKSYSKYHSQCLFEGSFIIGLPGETKESIKDSTNWLISNQALDFVNASPLYLLPYQSELDSVSIDFAEYSRNPNQYGISVLDKELNWQNSEMSSFEAENISREFLKTWTEQGHHTAIRNIFDYPNLRTLGFEKSEILEMARNPSQTDALIKEIMQRFQVFLENYSMELRHLPVHDRSKFSLNGNP